MYSEVFMHDSLLKLNHIYSNFASDPLKLWELCYNSRNSAKAESKCEYEWSLFVFVKTKYETARVVLRYMNSKSCLLLWFSFGRFEKWALARSEEGTAWEFYWLLSTFALRTYVALKFEKKYSIHFHSISVHSRLRLMMEALKIFQWTWILSLLDGWNYFQFRSKKLSNWNILRFFLFFLIIRNPFLDLLLKIEYQA